jgi:hypothetical protein
VARRLSSAAVGPTRYARLLVGIHVRRIQVRAVGSGAQSFTGTVKALP